MKPRQILGIVFLIIGVAAHYQMAACEDHQNDVLNNRLVFYTYGFWVVLPFMAKFSMAMNSKVLWPNVLSLISLAVVGGVYLAGYFDGGSVEEHQGFTMVLMFLWPFGGALFDALDISWVREDRRGYDRGYC